MSKNRTSNNCNSNSCNFRKWKRKTKKLDIIEQTLERRKRKIDVQIVRRLVATTLKSNMKMQTHVRIRSW